METIEPELIPEVQPEVIIEEVQQKQKKTITLSIQSAILLGSCIIAGAILSGPIRIQTPTTTQPDTGAKKEIKINPVTTADHILGNPTKAKLFIVEYSDLECPFCKGFHETMHQVVDHYNGNVVWVYRQFPLDKHPKARPEAYASECVAQIGGNDLFWKYIDQIFTTTQSNNSLDLSLLPTFATALGINKQAFDACVVNNNYKDKIDAWITDGTNAGLRGTPYSVIVSRDGKTTPIDGNLPYADMITLIDPLVK